MAYLSSLFRGQRDPHGQQMGRQFYWQTGYRNPEQMRFSRQRASEQAAGSLRSLIGSYNRAFGEARSANEQRYQQLLDIAGQTTSQREADLRADYSRQGSDIRQQLSRQGMAGTTVAPAMQMGVQREQQSALNRLADQMQQTKMGVIERREDRYPEASIITSLAGLLGQGAGPEGVGGLMSALSGMRMG